MEAGWIGALPTCRHYQTSKRKLGLVIRSDDDIPSSFLHYFSVFLLVRIVAWREDSGDFAEIDRYFIRKQDALEPLPYETSTQTNDERNPVLPYDAAWFSGAPGLNEGSAATMKSPGYGYRWRIAWNQSKL